VRIVAPVGHPTVYNREAMNKQLPVVRETACSRRAVLGGFGACAALALVRGASGCTPSSNLSYANASSCGETVCVNLGDTTNEPLTKVGGAMLVSGNDGDVLMLIRSSETIVLALDALCTHLECTLGFDASKKLLVCPCHGATFNEAGTALSGPTTVPLTVFNATLIGSTITITAS
jgi:thiosulfate dehydrogenase [quinone] large subunit